MNHKKQDSDMDENQHSFERERLLQECYSLLTLISKRPYSVKLLRAARDGLLLISDYKSNRRRCSSETLKG